jgi:hypothetical protein
MHIPFMGNEFPNINTDVKVVLLKNHYDSKNKLCNVLMSIFYLVYTVPSKINALRLKLQTADNFLEAKNSFDFKNQHKYCCLFFG